MYIYNVTINVADEAHYEWLRWMKEVHIPAVLDTGCFIDNQILKLLYVEDEGHTYSVQYRFSEIADIEKYQNEFAPELQADHKAKFADKFAAFRTILEVVA